VDIGTPSDAWRAATTAPDDEGPTPAQRVVLVVAAVVLVGALVGAFLTSSLADGLLGRDDGDGSTAAETRPPASNPTTTGAGTASSSAPGTSSTTATSSAPSTSASPGAEQLAVGIIRDMLRRCSDAAGLLPEGIANFTYDTVPADTPTRFYVTVTEAEGASATWLADTTSGEIIGAEPLAQDILAGCPPG
jgi:hypothetical protein